MNRKSLQAIIIPICALLIFALGILIGRNRAIDTAGIEADDKLSRALQLIKEQYVDTVNEDRLMDMALTSLFKSLDPHSEYIPASDLQSVNEDLEGSFSGVGISFQIVADTVTVIDAIVGGPAEKLGIMAGDRIISADGEPLAGPAVTNEDVFRLLRGKKGTVVDLEIKRQNSPNSTHFSVTRADIPVNTVDAAYLLDDRMTGYIKLSKFTPSSYTEFMDAMLRLQAEGAKSLILDLRDNPGGYMDQAILIANQFLPANRKIVFTKARTADNRMSAISDGTGILTRMPVAVLINEYSASASEIIAGAIQDNDRGPVVGRRSYGKGLVQTTRPLPYDDILKITTGRYYIPSGRLIQALDYSRRNPDGSPARTPDSLTNEFSTKAGRIVRDGGGITPDVSVSLPESNRLLYNIVTDQWAYDFVTKYVATNPAPESPADLKVTEEMFEDFKKSIDPARFKYDRQTESALKILRETAKSEGYLTDSVAAQLDLLGTLLKHDLNHDLDLNRNEIKEILDTELASRYFSDADRVARTLPSDSVLLKAREILLDPARYSAILSKPKK